MRVASVEADAGKRLGAHNDFVARRISTDDWVSGNGKGGRNEGMKAGGVAESDALVGVLRLFGNRSAGGGTHIVAMPERERNLCARAFDQDLVKPRLRRGLNCNFVVRRGTQCTARARPDAESTFTSSGVAGVALRVNDAHRKNMFRILVGMLA